ncbi:MULTISPECIES: hypothetical protein [unclassified Bacillus cereus group]|nr:MULTISPECIES: hypothetical protein [unclassified Bacillus cereus group]MDA2662849.1 hypothetical protein [Bacillus cereus group sp. Bc032]MDA2673572.1 hypothetical protein [Bacillus cereus group sp. Bc031]MDA2679000.1 hypothetical protein [Bacillus cereus group sp. Bc029]MDA2684510.1 hypothetical protein [Bacillus cereus group sp. Bc030]MDA2739985.1 hypothetical protein [Bacillus cereus group sp. Bc011]
MSLKRNMVFGIVGLLIPIFVLLYAVVYITLEKNMLSTTIQISPISTK